GLDVYEARYQVEPDPADYPDALRTMDDMKARCIDLGLPRSGRRDDLIARILDADPKTEFWDDICAGDGRTLVKAEWDKAIRMMHRVVSNHPDLRRAFSGGLAEVSVFWIEDDIRFRARFDYLKPAAVIDLKSFANSRGKEIRQAITGEIANYG